jgi:thiamine biosynthesis lipoprotein ApbE
MAVTPALGTRTQTLTFGAFGTTMTLAVVGPAEIGRAALALARAAAEGVETACTPPDGSPLGLVNAEPDSWHVVPPPLYLALERAARAYELTAGLADPRVRPRRNATVADAAPWRPAFDPERLAVRLDGTPVELGAVAKALAVDLASAALAGAGDVHLVDAGRDCRFGGHGPDRNGWRVAVEDPAGATEPLAVLRADDRAVATSQGRAPGLIACTVLASETSTAQAWSSALLLTGADEAPGLAATHELAALWVDEDRCLHVTPEAAARVLWLAPEVDVRDCG